MPTKIKIKRADSSASFTSVVLDHGEPAVDFQAGIFYIGDGSTSPGLEFAAIDSTGLLHQIASETSIGTQHTISSKKIGATLRATGTNTAKMERLGFYDLGSITDVTSGSSIDDSTGLNSRWHWMASEHVGSPRSVFATITDYASVGDGTGSGLGNMAHSGTGSSSIGYKIEEISYDISDLADTTAGAMPLVAYKNGSNNTLAFRRLGAQDLSGGTPVHDMTSTSHTMTAYSVVYSSTTNTIKYASYASAATGAALRKSSTSGTLEFAPIAYTDLTGVFRLPGNNSSSEGYMLRYDGTGINGWETVSNIRSLRTSTYNRFQVDNGTVTTLTPAITMRNYGDEGGGVTQLDITIPVDSIADLNSYAAGRVTIGTSNGTSAYRDILFYTYGDRVTDNPPNIWFRQDGALWVKTADNTSPSFSSLFSDITDTNSAIYVYPKKMGRISGSSSNYPGYNGLFIDDITHTQHIASTPNGEGFCGIRIGNLLSASSGTATTASHHNIYLFKGGNAATPASAFGIKTGAISGGDATGATSIGVDIDSVTVTSATGSAIGFKTSVISGTSVAYGINFSNIDSTGNTHGVRIGSITGSICSLIYATDVTSTTATRVFGCLSAKSSTTATGLYLPYLSGTTRTVGILIGVNTLIADTSISGHKAIYTAGGDHVFGGAVDITGVTTIDGNVILKDGRKLTVGGSTGTTSLTLTAGDVVVSSGSVTITSDIPDPGSGADVGVEVPANVGLHVARGHILVDQGVIIEDIIDFTLASSQVQTETGTLQTETQLKQNGTYRINPGSSSRIIYRIGKGFDGQKLTILNSSTTSSADLIFQIPSSTLNNGDIASSLGTEYRISPNRAIMFICDHNVATSYGTDYKWKPVLPTIT